MSENGEIYTAGKNFTLPQALTAWTNSTSEEMIMKDVGSLTLSFEISSEIESKYQGYVAQLFASHMVPEDPSK